MSDPRLVLCGGAKRPTRQAPWTTAKSTVLSIGSAVGQVRLAMRNLAPVVQSAVADVEADLLEVAAYIYAADQCVGRGGRINFDYGDAWYRRFRLEVPVRRPDVWQRPEVDAALRGVLGFQTGDEYEFGFCRRKNAPPVQQYLFEGQPCDVEEVMLFSGGLDSLGGAVAEVLEGRRSVALVSHRPEGRTCSRQQDLVAELRGRAGPNGPRVVHAAVEVTVGESQARDFNQRARSFLFGAIGAVVARLLGRNRLRFYENGVTSLNLPPCAQVVGTRASRTTHPRVLRGFERLFSALFDTAFTVENVFQWRTKADVLQAMKLSGHADLCARTVSCAHVRNRPANQPHCGSCSQCLERRLAALAAGYTGQEDNPAGYGADVLHAPREGADRILFERTVALAREIDSMGSAAMFVARFPELQTELGQFRMPPADALDHVFQMYQRHAASVLAGIEAALNGRTDRVVRGRFEPASLLGMACTPAAAESEAATASAVATQGTPRRPWLDSKKLAFVFGPHEIDLGPTREYQVAQVLVDRFGEFVPVPVLGDTVWGNAKVPGNTVQRVISDLRRLLIDVGLQIDGKRGRYRMRAAENLPESGKGQG